MNVIDKDITTVERGIILQQVNCQGIMGSGVAKAIRAKWPVVYDEYIEFIDINAYRGEFVEEPNSHLLGEVELVRVMPELIVANLFCQFDYNRPGSSERHTSYIAWAKVVEYLQNCLAGFNLPIYAPYLIGCDRGGGNWTIISELLMEYFPDIIFCKYGR